MWAATASNQFILLILHLALSPLPDLSLQSSSFYIRDPHLTDLCREPRMMKMRNKDLDVDYEQDKEKEQEAMSDQFDVVLADVFKSFPPITGVKFSFQNFSASSPLRYSNSATFP